MWDFWGFAKRRQYYTGGSLAPKYDKTQTPVSFAMLTPASWMRSGVPRVWPYIFAAIVVPLMSRPLAPLVSDWTVPFPFSAFVSILGFMLVFRTNIAYQRYWEARSMLEEFESKLTDVLIHSLALDRSNRAVYDLDVELQKKKNLSQATLSALERGQQRFKNVTAHLLSLLHATAFCTLRDDFDLFNLTVHFSGTPLWVTDANGNPLHPDQIQAHKENGQGKAESTSTQGCSGNNGCLGFANSKQKSPEKQANTLKRPNCPGDPKNDAMTPLLAPFDTVRQTHWAKIMAFVGRTSLHNSKDPCIHDRIDDVLEKAGENSEFTKDEEIPGCKLQVRKHWSWRGGLRPETSAKGTTDRRWMHRESRLPVIGGLSAAEAIALGAPATDQRPWLDDSFLYLRKRFDSGINEQSRCIPWLADFGSVYTPLDGDYDCNKGVTYADEVRHLPVARERAQVIHAWLVDVIMERHFLENGDVAKFESTRNGILQHLSSAMLAYQNCRKLSTHQLPWGWYQACHLGLWFFTILLPFVTTVFMKNVWFSIFASMIVVCFFATLHEVANYIEEPFRFYPNLIPLQLKQVSFNERLLAIMDSRRPMGPADVFKNVTNPVPFQACRWLSQKGKASLINLWCKNLGSQKNGKRLLSFVPGLHPSRAKICEYDPSMPYPLPRHQLSEGDTVLIRHDVGTGGFHEEIREEVVGEGVVRAVDAYCITVDVDKKIKGKSWETLFWLGRTEVKAQDRCWGCSNPAISKQQLRKRDNDVDVLTDEGMRDKTHIAMKTRFTQRDIDCIRQLKMHQLEDKELPDYHVLMLYRYMDISRCRLCTAIYDTLQARNQHWIANDLFDPLVHEFKCGLTSECRTNKAQGGSTKGNSTKSSNLPRSKARSYSISTQGSFKAPCDREHVIKHRLALAEKEVKQLRRQYAPSPFYARASRHLDPEHDAYCQGQLQCQHLNQRLEHMWEKVATTVKHSAQTEEHSSPGCNQGKSAASEHAVLDNNLEGEYVDGQFREGRFNVAANLYVKDPRTAAMEDNSRTSKIPRPKFQTYEKNKTFGEPMSLKVRGKWKVGESRMLESKLALSVKNQFQAALVRYQNEPAKPPKAQAKHKQRGRSEQRGPRDAPYQDHSSMERTPEDAYKGTYYSKASSHASMTAMRSAPITLEAEAVPKRSKSSTYLIMNPMYGSPEDF